MNANEIEPIPDDPSEAMSALCQSALLYQSLLEKCIERCPEMVEQFTEQELQGMKLADAIILHWREYLEITD